MLEVTWQENDGAVLTEHAERWTKDAEMIHLTTPGSQLLIPIRRIRWLEIRPLTDPDALGPTELCGPWRVDRSMLNLSHPIGGATVTRGERPEPEP